MRTLSLNLDIDEKLVLREYPPVIKYMGSKSKIIPFITQGVAQVYGKGGICDLFSGACSLAGAMGHCLPMISNDIQHYSKAIAYTYLKPISKALNIEPIIKQAGTIVAQKKATLPEGLAYPTNPSLEEFRLIEKNNQLLLSHNFEDSHYLFLKNYAGTWWSAEQCLWIDAIRAVIDQQYQEHRVTENDFYILLTCLMHAMAYCSQGTGHYAQYRDAKTAASMNDINKYRQKSIAQYFTKKFETIKTWNLLHVKDLGHEIYALDYQECLAKIPPCTVYADPPYAFVHYSRFYHAIETFVRYDYPALQVKGETIVKGRYREVRHQSPFCIRTQVKSAFQKLFEGVRASGSHLVLSYSNTGMIEMDELLEIALKTLGHQYTTWVEHQTHIHMTMGRKEDRDRAVQESLIIAKKQG